MALKDHEEADGEELFYGQYAGEDAPGVVSVWVSLIPAADIPEDVDVLQDWCGMGYYSLDDQETVGEGQLASVESLASKLSFGASFSSALLRGLALLGIDRAHWLMAQYDLRYEPEDMRPGRNAEVVYVGASPYVDEED